jgi:hypothetical protein
MKNEKKRQMVKEDKRGCGCVFDDWIVGDSIGHVPLIV